MKSKPIADIFSKAKEPIEKPLNLIADIREKNSMIISELIAKKVNIFWKTLEIGDYLIGDTIIERKTFNDFVSSMLNKRLLFQLPELKKYPNYFLIIEHFNFDYDYFQSENVIRGMLLSVILKHKVPIIFTKDEQDTADFLVVLAKRQNKPEQEISLRPATPRTKKEQKEFILEGFPEIGPKSAKKLLEKFNTLENIFKASPEELKEILKDSKTKSFKEILES